MTLETGRRFARACAFVAGVIVVLAGCTPGPSADDLRKDIAARLDNDLAPGLLELEKISQTGGTTAASLERERRTIHYSADLRLKRDHDFGAWDQINALALLETLGAKVGDVTGLKTGGNHAGDVIHAAGALTYARNEERWVLMSSAPENRPAAATPVGRGTVLREFGRLAIATARALVFTSQAAIVRDELLAAAARIARLESRLAIASGPPGSDTWGIGRAAQLQRAGTGAPIINLATKDSVEGLRLLHDGRVTAAIIRNDEAALAGLGNGPFERAGTFPELRALGSLFPEPLQVIVMAASNIASVTDLYGKHIGVVDTGPAAINEANDALRAHRLLPITLAGPLDEQPIDSALMALEKGELDAVIVASLAPNAAVRAFATNHSIRLVPLDGDAIALLTAGTSNYVAITVPARAYPQQTRPIATVAVTAQLVSVVSVSNSEIDALLELFFRETDYLRHGSAAGAMISAHGATTGLTLPLHLGAEAFFANAPQK